PGTHSRADRKTLDIDPADEQNHTYSGEAKSRLTIDTICSSFVPVLGKPGTDQCDRLRIGIMQDQPRALCLSGGAARGAVTAWSGRNLRASPWTARTFIS